MINTLNKVTSIFKELSIDYILLSRLQHENRGDIDIKVDSKRFSRKNFNSKLEEKSLKILLSKKGIANNIVYSLYDLDENQTLRLDLYNRVYLTSGKTLPYMYYLNINYLDYRDKTRVNNLNNGAKKLHYVLRKILKKDFSLETKLRLNKLKRFKVPEGSPISNSFIDSLIDNYNQGSHFELVDYLRHKRFYKKTNKLLNALNFIKNKFNPNSTSIKHISIIGPDGCGKSTLLELVEKEIIYIYGKCKYIHLRPTLVPSMRGLKAKVSKRTQEIPKPHESKNYNTFFSHIKFFILYIDYLFGYFKIKLYMLLGYYVISDRYFYDIIVDPKRFNIIKTHKYQKFLIKYFLPRPSITLFLWAPAEIISGRKKDLTLPEIKRQLIEYSKLMLEFPEIKKINSSISPNEVFQKVKKVLFWHRG